MARPKTAAKLRQELLDKIRNQTIPKYQEIFKEIMTVKKNELSDQRDYLAYLQNNLRAQPPTDPGTVRQMIVENLNTEANEMGVLYKDEDAYVSAFGQGGVDALLTLLEEDFDHIMTELKVADFRINNDLPLLVSNSFSPLENLVGRLDNMKRSSIIQKN